MPHTLKKLAAGAVIAAAALFGATAPALAHDELVGVGAELNEEQTLITLTLQFNNEIMDIGAEFIATAGSDNLDLIEGAPTVSGREVTQQLTFPGFGKPVTAAWTVVSSDGHRISEPLYFALSEREDGETVLQFFEEDQLPGGTQQSAEEEVSPGNTSETENAGSPAVFWSLFTIAMTLAVITSAVVATRAKHRRQAAAQAAVHVAEGEVAK